MISKASWALVLIIGVFDFITRVDGASKLCVGSDHTCFVRINGDLLCWGNGSSGQIGPKESVSAGTAKGDIASLLPIATGVDRVTCGQKHTCFMQAGQVFCLGANDKGQLGRSSTTFGDLGSALSFSGDIPADVVAFGGGLSDATCALASGKVYCWGTLNSVNLGSTPQLVPNLNTKTISQVAMGAGHVCALATDGQLFCWGDNFENQLGIGNTNDQATPTLVQVSFLVASVTAGFEHTCVTNVSGQIFCFGNNNSFELGDSSNVNKGISVSEMQNLVANLLGPGIPFAGKDVTCAFNTASSNLHCVGDNFFGMICSTTKLNVGDVTDDYPPSNPLVFGIDVTSSTTVALGPGSHACLTDGDEVYCWGSNLFGQLGIDSTSFLVDCTTLTSLQQVCFDGVECKDEFDDFRNKQLILLITYVCVVVLCGVVPMICTVAYACHKRKQFDNLVFILPNGSQTTGGKIWDSYTRPLAPPRSAATPIQSFNVVPSVPMATPVGESMNMGYTPKV